MKWFNNMLSRWRQKEQQEEIVDEESITDDPEPEPEPEPEPLPNEIEVPWPSIAHLTNLEEAYNNNLNGLKELLYNAKLREAKYLKLLDELQEKMLQKSKELKALYKIEKENEYDIYLPESYGQSGHLRRAKKNKD